MAKVITAAEAAALIQDGWSIAVGGFVGSGHPEALSRALESRFLSQGRPKGLSLMCSAGQGDGKRLGMNHFAHSGMLRRVIGGHWNWAPKLGEMAVDNQFEAYNLPQGTLVQLYGAMACGQPGVITKTGLGTFVDPRQQGGRLNEVTIRDLVELIHLDGEEWLRYKPVRLDAVLLRGTSADPQGNISTQREAVRLELLQMAQAARSQGGIVIVQVEELVPEGGIPPKEVTVPGVSVDYVVPARPEEHWQTYDEAYSPIFAGMERKPLNTLAPLPLDIRKVIARRAFQEITSRCVVNLGIGIPEGVAGVANEAGRASDIVLTVEAGGIGGVPAGGLSFGAVYNASATMEHSQQFAFYDGGGLDVTCLGFAQADQAGNVNVSRFNGRIAGCGGFINITQNTSKVIFCGGFTAGSSEIQVRDGALRIVRDGAVKKFISAVEQISFSAGYAVRTGKRVLYVTERAVFSLSEEGLVLEEIAPGVDLERDILGRMGFEPLISKRLREMPRELFLP